MKTHHVFARGQQAKCHLLVPGRHSSSLSKQQRPAPSVERSYVYFLNQRGQLFHVFDVEGFVTRRTTPSGPTFLRDPQFLDFFFARLIPNTKHYTTNCDRRNLSADGEGANAASQSLVTSERTGMCHKHPWDAWEVFDRLGRHERRQVDLRRSDGEENGGSLIPKKTSDDDDELIRSCRAYFPWCSACGREMNYFVAEDAPVVFTDLQWQQVSSSESEGASRREEDDGEAEWKRRSTEVNREAMEKFTTMLTSSSTSRPAAQLVFAGTMTEPFDPSKLRCSRDGRLYHPVCISTHFILKRAWGRAIGSSSSDSCTLPTTTTASASPNDAESQTLFGLVGSQVGLRLGLDFVCEDQTEDGNFTIEWVGRTYIIPFMDTPSS